MRLRRVIAALAAVAAGSWAGAAMADPADCGSVGVSLQVATYTCTNLGAPSGVDFAFGGITFLDANTLLVVGDSDNAGGGGDTIPNTNIEEGSESRIYTVQVERDSDGHITGFGSATLLTVAPDVDGGLAFYQNSPSSNLLFFTEYGLNGDNTLGELTPDGSGGWNYASYPLPDTENGSVGSLAFDPYGNLVVAKYDNGDWYDIPLNPDGSINGPTDSFTPATTLSGIGPEGIVYSGSEVLVSSWNYSEVLAYSYDANGTPIGTGTPIVTGLACADGSAVDPVTGDILFSSEGVYRHSGECGVSDSSPNQYGTIILLSDPALPEPGSLSLLASGLVGFEVLRRRRRSDG
jgi:hypothetical protein